MSHVKSAPGQQAVSLSAATSKQRPVFLAGQRHRYLEGLRYLPASGFLLLALYGMGQAEEKQASIVACLHRALRPNPLSLITSPSSEAMSLSLLASLSFVLCCGTDVRAKLGTCICLLASPRTVFYMWNTPALEVVLRSLLSLCEIFLEGCHQEGPGL